MFHFTGFFEQRFQTTIWNFVTDDFLDVSLPLEDAQNFTSHVTCAKAKNSDGTWTAYIGSTGPVTVETEAEVRKVICILL